jgi:hypothetical protein
MQIINKRRQMKKNHLSSLESGENFHKIIARNPVLKAPGCKDIREKIYKPYARAAIITAKQDLTNIVRELF